MELSDILDTVIIDLTEGDEDPVSKYHSNCNDQMNCATATRAVNVIIREVVLAAYRELYRNSPAFSGYAEWRKRTFPFFNKVMTDYEALVADYFPGGVYEDIWPNNGGPTTEERRELWGPGSKRAGTTQPRQGLRLIDEDDKATD
jgi:hypothetical protein